MYQLSWTRLYQKIKWLFLAIGILILLAGFRQRVIFNPSISEPRGYYLIGLDRVYNTGDLVEICINDKKYLAVLKKLKLPFNNNECESNMGFLLKQIVAKEGDLVNVTRYGVFINGVLQANSMPLVYYKKIQLYPSERRYWLKKNEFFVLGETPHSYDSRYFGVINKKEIKHRVYLLFKCNKILF